LKNKLSTVKSQSILDEIAEAVENDRKRAMLPGIVLMIMTFFKECVEDFFQVAEVIHITY